MSKLIFLVGFIFLSVMVIAQPGQKNERRPFFNRDKNNERHQKDRAIKDVPAIYIGYITKKLDLTETESQQFWVVHGQLEKDLRLIKDENDELVRQQKVLDLRKQYSPKFSAIIGNERTNQFWKIQGRFLTMLKKRAKREAYNKNSNL